jgi:hypothetical protein
MQVKHSVLLLMLVLASGYAARSCSADEDQLPSASNLRSGPELGSAGPVLAAVAAGLTADLPTASAGASAAAPPAAAPPREADRQLQQYTALAASTHPADRYAAYQMLRACEQLRTMVAIFGLLPRGQVGTDMLFEVAAENQRQLDNRCKELPHADARIRLALLRDAVASGIPGAPLNLYDEGPNGEPRDLWQRPDDLNVQQWFATTTAAIAEQARLGDIESSYRLSSIHDPYSGIPAFTDLDKSALYATLGLELLRRSAPSPHDMRSFREQATKVALERLPAERAAAIKAEVAAILAKL